MKYLLCLFCFIFTLGCTTPHSSTSDKTLTIPSFEQLERIDLIYTNDSNKSYETQYFVHEDTPTLSCYESLKDAKYIEKMKSNDVLDVANITITIRTLDKDKIIYVIYKDGNTYYLEDIANIDLYSTTKEVFDEFVKLFNV